MSIKKLLLSALLLTTTVFAYAEDITDYIKIDDCTIIAGVDDKSEGIVNINLENSQDWCAMQFDLYLPTGISLKNPKKTERLTYTYWDEDDEEEYTKEFEMERNTQSDGAIRFVIFNFKNGKVSNNGNNKAILTVRLIATDQASTGEYTAYVKNAILSNSVDNSQGHAVVNGSNAPEQESKFKIQINAKVGKGGYGTFSWPRDVDFTNAEGVEEVYVASGAAVNGWLHLDPITSKKVPAGTGVFIKGTAGATVNPETLDEELASITSSLGETSTAPFEAGKNVFALATKNGKTALYPVSEGVIIPKYKAYMTSADGAKLIAFDDMTTGINAMDMADEDGDIYTLGGQKVQKTTMKGVYIKNGQKVVVK